VNGHHRLSDADRAAAVERLVEHETAGRLTANEVRDRSAAVRAARTRADLGRVFADLPADRSLRHAWRDRGWRAHALVFAVITTATVLVWLVVRDPEPPARDYGADYWWPLWFALAWAAAVLLHLVWTAGTGGTGWWRPGPVDAPANVSTDEPSSTAPASTRVISNPPTAAPAPRPEPPTDADAALLGRLTTREREVLALVGQGRANRDIATALYISERTARTHVSNILRKLELSSRTQAAILANRVGPFTGP
jgi:DNA-binding CsgD family transcriptional regulator